MTRKPGFYWVLDDGEWFIAEWTNKGRWLVTGANACGWLEDIDFEEIDEERLERNV